MVVRQRKKDTRQRGSTSHGWGSKKKHRGSGNRGGFGFAGYGKRSDHYKPYFVKRGELVGRTGFASHRRAEKPLAINIEYIQQHILKLVNEGKVQKKDDIYVVDLEKLGYQKILGSGTVLLKFHIIAPLFSKKAEEKIKKAGGTISSENGVGAKAEPASPRHSVQGRSDQPAVHSPTGKIRTNPQSS